MFDSDFYIWLKKKCKEFDTQYSELDAQVSDLKARNQVLEKNETQLAAQMSAVLDHLKKLDEQVAALKTRNQVLEKNIKVDYETQACIIQKYWKKHVLVKRIKEASRVYKLTKNFIHFINPHEMLEKKLVAESPPPRHHVRCYFPPKKSQGESSSSEWSKSKANQIAKDWMN
jgi:hypothetical protein